MQTIGQSTLNMSFQIKICAKYTYTHTAGIEKIYNVVDILDNCIREKQTETMSHG